MNESEKDKNILSLFSDIVSYDETKRLSSSQKLLDILNEKQQKADDDNLCEEVKYAFKRLVGGLASGRKMARLGFATTLSALLRVVPCNQYSSQNVVKLMEEKLHSNGEDKDIMFGRIFCLLSVIQSERLSDEKENSMLRKITEMLLKLGKKKSYLHKISLHGLSRLVVQVSAEQFRDHIWPLLCPEFAKGWSASSAELMQLLLTCSKQHPTVCDTEFLKTSKWLPSKTKHKNIIASHSFKHLSQVIAKTTMYHPNIDQFAREIVTTIGSLGTDALGTFWDQHLTPTLFSSSPERKYLGFMLAVFSFDLISSKKVPAVWSKDLLNNLYYALTNKENPLHLVCRNELPKILSEKMSQENVSHEVQLAVVFQTFTSPGGLHLDGITHSAIVTSLVSRFKLPALLNYIQWLKHLFIHGTTDKTMIREINLDVARKWSSSHLLHLIRMTSLPRNEKWISSIVRFLLLHSHFSFLGNDNNSHIDEISMVGEHFMDLSESTRSHVHQNFLTSVSWLSNMAPLPPDETSVVTNEPKVVIPGLMSSGRFWLASIVDFADSLVSCEHVKPVFNFNDNVKKSWLAVVQNISKVLKLKNSTTNQSAEATALQLLLLHVALQLLSLDDEVQKSTQDVVSDLTVIVRERFEVKGQEQKVCDGDPDWVEVIVEILLTMMSQASSGSRKTADQVFKLICPHLTKNAIKLITDVLQMKDDLMLKEEEEEEEEEGEDHNDPDDTDESSGSPSSDEDEVETEDVDEEFRKKIKEALGDAAGSTEEDEESDGSDEDFSDDAMMRIDHLLSNIFRHRKKSKKAEEVATKRQLTHFQLRCLDLVDTFIARQHSSNPLVLDLVLPLLDVVHVASRDPNKDTLAEKASVLLRVKLCKMKGYPRDLDDDVISRCHDNIEEALSRCRRGIGGLFIGQLASQCCMFYLRVLSGNTGTGKKGGAVDVSRVVSLYASALEDFMMRRESKLQHHVVHDFATRYTALAQQLIIPLTRYIKDGVQVYRKTQACSMLLSLLSSPTAGGNMMSICPSLLDTIVDILSNLLNSPATIKPKYLVELLRLLHLLVHSTSNKGRDWSDLISLLRNFLELNEMKRSQELTNAAWKVLTGVGVSRGKKEKTTKKRKLNDAKESPAIEGNPPSRNQLKKQIRKAKKEKRMKIEKSKDIVNNGL